MSAANDNAGPAKPDWRTKHGYSYAPEYRAWQTMRLRCTVPTNPAWADYGGRGITVCERWLNSVAAFVADMGPKPSPKHEIDRIDNDGNYEPGNCRWVTRLEQAANKRPVHCSTCGGTGHNRRRCASVAA